MQNMSPDIVVSTISGGKTMSPDIVVSTISGLMPVVAYSLVKQNHARSDYPPSSPSGFMPIRPQ